MPQTAPESQPRQFDFADLGRPLPPSVRVLPDADASGQHDELDADDILKTNDIDALEAAAAGIRSFETPAPESVPAPISFDAPASDPNGFEVAEMGSFDEVEVEGLAVRATVPSPDPVHVAAPAPAPAPAPASTREPNPSAVIGRASHAPTLESAKFEARPAQAAPPAAEAAQEEAAPISIKLNYASPSPSTLMGMPAAPITSPLPLESIIVDDAFPEKTLEIRGNDMAKVQAVAAQLAAGPEHTEILSRSAMPAALQSPQSPSRGWQPITSRTSAPTPAPANVQAQNAQAPQRRPSSIAPVALDVETPRPRMASIPQVHQAHAYMPPPRRGMSGLAIGGIIGAAVMLVGLIGVGGFVATRALSDKDEPTAIAPSGEAAGSTTTTAGSPGAAGSPFDPAAAGSPTGSPASPIDVSALPSAPAAGRGAAPPPRGFTGSGGFGGSGSDSTGSGAIAAGSGGSGAGATGASRGGALPPPGARPTTLAPPGPAPTQASRGAATALPPPGAALSPGGGLALPPPVAAAAPAPKVASTTGVIRVDPKLRAVLVDGRFQRADDGVVTVSCGSHRVKAGMNDQQTVNVPCGGAVSL